MTKSELKRIAAERGISLAEARLQVNAEQFPNGKKQKVTGHDYKVLKSVEGKGMVSILGVGELQTFSIMVSNKQKSEDFKDIVFPGVQLTDLSGQELAAIIGSLLAMTSETFTDDMVKKLSMLLTLHATKYASFDSARETGGIVITYFKDKGDSYVSRVAAAFDIKDLLTCMEETGDTQSGTRALVASTILNNPFYEKDNLDPSSNYFQYMELK